MHHTAHKHGCYCHNGPHSETGDYHTDFTTGRACGRTLIQALRAQQISPFTLADIVNQLPRPITTLNAGLLAEIAMALT